MGGGKALLNAYYRNANSLGVEVWYDVPVTHLELQGDRIRSIEYSHQGNNHLISPKAMIVASGGFQVDID
jgi:tricarballylate dehydrogenase